MTILSSPTRRSREFTEDNLCDDDLQEIAQGRLQSENKNPSETFRGDVPWPVANGMLGFDGEQQSTEEVMHVFHTHFSLDDLRRIGDIDRGERMEIVVVIVHQNEIAVFDRDEKVEKGKDEPTDDESEQDERQDEPPLSLHDEENHVRMHVLQLTCGRILDIDPTILVHETKTIDLHRLIGNVLLRSRRHSSSQAKQVTGPWKEIDVRRTDSSHLFVSH